MVPADFGIDGGWGGIRTTSAFVAKFPSTGGGSVLVSPNEGATYPVINLPGSYQGWDPENDETAVASVNDDGNYGIHWFIKKEGQDFAEMRTPVVCRYGPHDTTFYVYASIRAMLKEPP